MRSGINHHQIEQKKIYLNFFVHGIFFPMLGLTHRWQGLDLILFHLETLTRSCNFIGAGSISFVPPYNREEKYHLKTTLSPLDHGLSGKGSLSSSSLRAISVKRQFLVIVHLQVFLYNMLSYAAVVEAKG